MRLPLFVARLLFMLHVCVGCMCVWGSGFGFACLCLYDCFASGCVPVCLCIFARLRFIVHVCIACVLCCCYCYLFVCDCMRVLRVVVCVFVCVCCKVAFHVTHVCILHGWFVFMSKVRLSLLVCLCFE